MDWPRNAIRLSAALSGIVGALEISASVFAIVSGMMDALAAAIFLLGALIPLASGILVLSGRAQSLLLLAWGWVLGVHLSGLLESLPKPIPDVPVEMDGPFVFGPDYSDAFLVVVALLGLMLYFFGAPRELKKAETK